jgi:hypothetical protein
MLMMNMAIYIKMFGKWLSEGKNSEDELERTKTKLNCCGAYDNIKTLKMQKYLYSRWEAEKPLSRGL